MNSLRQMNSPSGDPISDSQFLTMSGTTRIVSAASNSAVHFPDGSVRAVSKDWASTVPFHLEERVENSHESANVELTHPPRLSTMRTRAGIFLYRHDSPFLILDFRAFGPRNDRDRFVQSVDKRTASDRFLVTHSPRLSTMRTRASIFLYAGDDACSSPEQRRRFGPNLGLLAGGDA